jgi:uncharacterized protein involved in exopolysaccharide biosynthesis
MAQNKFRHENKVQAGPFLWWLLILGLVGIAALYYVQLKNSIHASGARVKVLERELAELVTQDEVIRAKIALLSSRSVLQKRLDEGFIKLMPITDDRLVRMDAGVRGGRGELRAVSNREQAP